MKRLPAAWMLAAALLLLLGLAVGCRGQASSPDQLRDTDRERALEELKEAALVVEAMAIPQDKREKARCIVVVPSFLSGGLLVGAGHGHGVVSCRTGAVWSGPAFITVSAGSAGLQAGFESADVVMLVMSERGVGKLFGSTFHMGAETSFAAGPAGAERQASTDETMTAEIVSYARARGLFAGAQLNGAVLKEDRAASLAFYRGSPDIQAILAGSVAPPTEAGTFVEGLQRAFQ